MAMPANPFQRNSHSRTRFAVPVNSDTLGSNALEGCPSTYPHRLQPWSNIWYTMFAVNGAYYHCENCQQGDTRSSSTHTLEPVQSAKTGAITPTENCYSSPPAHLSERPGPSCWRAGKRAPARRALSRSQAGASNLLIGIRETAKGTHHF
jgi:hypothetical protein